MPLSRLIPAVSILVFALATVAAARDERPLTNAKSENGRYILRIVPGRVDSRPTERDARRDDPSANAEAADDADHEAYGSNAEASDGAEFGAPAPENRQKSDKPEMPSAGRAYPAKGGCLAKLYVRRDGEMELVYSTRLVNAVAPVHAFISDDGRHLVTLDDFSAGGAAHAVVLYDEDGHVRREFSLRDLLTREDWSKVRQRGERVEWLHGGSFRFGEVRGEARFVIALRWGSRIEIDLESGDLEGDRPIADASEIPTDLLAMGALDGESLDFDSDSIPDVALMDGEEQRLRESAESLTAKLAELQALSPDSDAERSIVAAALAAIQAQLAGLDSGDPVSNPEEAEAETTVPGQPVATADTPATEILARVDYPTAGRSTEFGQPVPAANPAAPVDYVAWFQAQTRADESPAADMIAAAAQSTVNLPEELQDLYGRAMKGDAEALRSPEIAAWISANRAAIDQLQAATELPYHGSRMASADGTLIGFLLPNLGPVRQLSRAAVLDGKRLELEGRTQEAAEQYIHTIAVGSQQGQGPTLIESLVGTAVQALAHEALLDAYAADTGTLDYDALHAQLQKRSQPIRPVESTIQFERAMVLDIVQRGFVFDEEAKAYRVTEESAQAVGQVMGMVSAEDANPIQQTAMGVWLASTGFDNLNREVNTHFDEMAELATLPYSQALPYWDEFEERLSHPIHKATNPILSVLTPSVSRASELRSRGEAQRRAVSLVTQLRRYHKQHGAYPDSLDALGEVPDRIDPFTGAPFVYRRDGEDFVLRSVGRDGIEDHQRADVNTPANDFSYWPRKPRP